MTAFISINFTQLLNSKQSVNIEVTIVSLDQSDLISLQTPLNS